ncbi:DUF475 domain-containing protein [Oenococcus alcoholitolerans]|uniref:DUF475 domain-containing protein n=1 Tax=Oenococcus alcoholitolerans TaxID=931074 RepID=UPI003F6F8D90
MNLLLKLYGPFFEVKNWSILFTDPDSWLVILSLVALECLLSVDNAVVLAAQTQVLPEKEEREKSLFYGIIGAYVFRFLINFWEIKVIGSLYLFYLVFSFFKNRKKKKLSNKKRKTKKKKYLSLFWSVVIQIELMDIVFSIDSVLVSIAVSNNPVIVLIGGMIGILTMRGVAEIIMGLMTKLPELQTAAYILIAFISLKLILSIPMIDIEIPFPLFGSLMIVIITATLIIHYAKQKNKK